MLSPRGEAFEPLGVDPDDLFTRIVAPPPGLFT